MINGMDTLNSVVPTTLQGDTKETPPGKPDDVTQKHDITSYLKTDSFHEQQTVDLSSRTITDLKTPSRTPYYGSSEAKKAIMDNSSIGNYCATYAHLSDEFTPKTVRIGNQELMTLDPSQPFVDPTLAADSSTLELHNFSFLTDFLRKNSAIKYIVDIGCGDVEVSLLMQNHLKELGFQIKVIPVDVNDCRAEAEHYGIKAIPFNLIPAQEIAGATPATTLFTAIHPFTDEGEEAEQLSREITQGKTDYYITTLIKNNPGCFVLATEDAYISSPQRYIPLELVYTRHYHAIANSHFPKEFETRALRRAKATEMNAENGNIHRLNQLLAKLPEQRDRYLASISRITDCLKEPILEKPEEFWPDIISKIYMDETLFKANVDFFEGIQNEVLRNDLEMHCWHVYRQGINTSEVTGQTKEP